MFFAVSLALFKAGSSMPARMAMIAMTTSYAQSIRFPIFEVKKGQKKGKGRGFFMEKTAKSGFKKQVKYAQLPSVWVSAPLFPPLPQDEPYSITFLDGKYSWTTGCKNTLAYTREYDSPYLRGFDIRHYDLIAAFISEYRKGHIDKTGRLFVSYKGLLTLIGRTNGTSQIKTISLLLDDLWNTNILWEDNEKKSAVLFRTLSKIETKTEDGNKTLVSIQFDPNFITFIDQIEKFISVRLDVKVKLPSPVAQAIYTYIPSRAIYSTEKEPWRISLTTLMKELRLPLEKYSSKSERKKLFTQNKTSIMQQLDGQPLRSGDLFRCKLEEKKDKKDYYFCCWVKKIEKKTRKSPLLQCWIDAGLDVKIFYKLIDERKPLTRKTISDLKYMGLDPVKDQAYFEAAKSILAYFGDSDFEGFIADIKCRFDEGTVRQPQALLAYNIRQKINPLSDMFDSTGKAFTEMDEEE